MWQLKLQLQAEPPQGNAGPDRADEQCHGADRARGLPVADVRWPSANRRSRSRNVHVAGHSIRLAALLATAVAYAELSKLYPGAGSSYFFAEQAFLSKKQAFKFARVSKFMVGWASHLYYWVYPGVMVGVTAMIVGYMIGQVDSHFSDGSHFSASIPSPIFMWVFCIFFSFMVSYIAYRGVVGSTGVGVAINVTQITALLHLLRAGHSPSCQSPRRQRDLGSQFQRCSHSIRSGYHA